MAYIKLTQAEITVGAATAWTDVDFSAYGVPSGSVGIKLRASNNNGSNSQALGWRPNGSTDNRTQVLRSNSQMFFCCGLDASLLAEMYVGSTTQVDLYLEGYFDDDGSAVFFENSVAKSTGTTSSWVDVDISSDTGADTAILGFFEVVSQNTTYNFGMRMNGSTDDRRSLQYNSHAGYAVGVDESEICEQWISNTFVDLFLNGYLTAGAMMHANGIELSLGSTGSYADLSALTTGAIAGVIEVYNTGTTNSLTWALRENGTSFDYYRRGYASAGIVDCDGSYLVEGKISSTEIEFYELGVITEAGGSTNLVIADTTHSHAADNVVLTQDHVLVVAEAAHAHSADNISLTQLHVLVVADASHSHATDNVVITQDYILALQDALHGHSADNIDITQDHQLALDDTQHGHSADNVTVTMDAILEVADAGHAHAADGVVVTQDHILAMQDALHGHSADNIELSASVILSIADALHAHVADSVVLTQAHVLVIQDALHSHAADAILIAQDHVLIISDALHSHIADSLTLTLPTTSITPASRVFVIERANRVYVIARENRIYTIH